MQTLARALILVAMVTFPGAAAAQGERALPLSDLLRDLQRDSRYAGRIVGTHVVRPPSGGQNLLYEVRILAADDRIIIVHLDPRTGAVVRNPEAWLRRSGNR